MTKKFDKANALHFKLLHRSVKDKAEGFREFVPLNELAEDNLEQVVGKPLKSSHHEEAPRSDLSDFSSSDTDHADNDHDHREGDSQAQAHPVGHEAGEAAKYGIFYDDRHYDYTKHLRKIGEAPDAIFIPAAGKEDYHEEEDADDDAYGDEDYYYSSRHPAIREALDALEDDAYDTGDFDDDFVVKLDRDETAVLAPVPNFHALRKAHHQSYKEDAENQTDDDDDDHFSLPDTVKTAFTTLSSFSKWDLESLRGKSYAASIAITHIDSKFEHILRQYEQDEDDNLSDVDSMNSYGGDDHDHHHHHDHDNGHNALAEDALAEALEEFILEERNYLRPSVAERRTGAAAFLDEIRQEMGPISEAVLNRVISDTDDDDAASDDLPPSDGSSEEERFDCQSVLTTYTTTENLPSIIREVKKKSAPTHDVIRLSRKGIPILSTEETHRRVVLDDDDDEDKEDEPRINKGAPRNREETVEEKKARKSALKKERRENRATKKELKVRFASGV